MAKSFWQVSKDSTKSSVNENSSNRFLYVLAFLLVVLGMLNTIPAIPGLEQLVWDLSGNNRLVVRKFPYEYFFPLIFLIMMVIVALKHSFYRSFNHRGPLVRSLSLILDISLLLMALLISVSYVIEIDSICLIDQFTGERAELIAKSLKEEKEFAELYGLPEPDSVDDPSCINTLGPHIFLMLTFSIFVFLTYNIKVCTVHYILLCHHGPSPIALCSPIAVSHVCFFVVLLYFLFSEDEDRLPLLIGVGRSSERGVRLTKSAVAGLMMWRYHQGPETLALPTVTGQPCNSR